MKVGQIDKTIQQLRDNGWKVNIRHYRWVEYKSSGDVALVMKPYIFSGFHRILPNGGKVTVTVTQPGWGSVTCVAECSEKEAFRGKVGTAIALGRVMHRLREQGVLF